MGRKSNHPHRKYSNSVASILTLLALVSHNLNRRDLYPIKYSLTCASSSSRRRPHFLLQGASAASTNDERHQDFLQTLDQRPMNYYELLDLESTTTHRHRKTQTLYTRKKRASYRSKITSDQIKKAYRKQAQLYHPDKLAARKLKLERQNITDTTAAKKGEMAKYANDALANMTVEDATSRFAHIAEAYQVLSDPSKRYDYDWDLLEKEDENEEKRLLALEQQTHRMGQKPSSYYDTVKSRLSNFYTWKNDLNLDPWAVFEEFFFQDSDMYDDAAFVTKSGSYSRDHDIPFYPRADNRHDHQSFYPSGHSPFRVSEDTVYRGFDPNVGSNVYTLLRREEYITDELSMEGKIYYQIIGQDYITATQLDPFTGLPFDEYYSAITEPYLVEEGYSKEAEFKGYGTSPQSDTAKYVKQRRSSHTLEQGESIALKASLNDSVYGSISNEWISLNGIYKAILTPTCELQIVRHEKKQHNVEESDNDMGTSIDTVIWSSETFIPSSRAHGCHLILNSEGRLVLSVDFEADLKSDMASINRKDSGDKKIYSSILWSTPSPPILPQWIHGEKINATEKFNSFRYYASLDNDGVMAVYRVRLDMNSNSADSEPTTTKNNKGEGEEINSIIKPKLQIPQILKTLNLMYHRLSTKSLQQNKKKSAVALNQMRYNIRRLIMARPRIAGITEMFDASSTNTNVLHRNSNTAPKVSGNILPNHECIYSTSPIGCLTTGRIAIYFTNKFSRYVKHSLKRIDSKLDSIIMHLSEPVSEYNDNSYMYNFNENHEQTYPSYNGDDDDDILDTLFRVMGAARVHLGTTGIQLSKVGIQAANTGMKRGRQTAGKVVGKMRETVGKYSNKWKETMSENDDLYSIL